MRTTIISIENELIAKASRLTGSKEKISLMRLGLEALIANERSKQLAKSGPFWAGFLNIPNVMVTEWSGAHTQKYLWHKASLPG
jgi:hypothetical protein